MLKELYFWLLLIMLLNNVLAQEIEEVDTDEYFQPKSRIGIINVTLKQEI